MRIGQTGGKKKSATTIKCFTVLDSNQFVWCIFFSGFSPLCPWQILVVVVFVELCPVRFLLYFSAGWRSAYLAGGSAFRPLWFVFVVFCAVDLPSYTEPQSVIGRTGGKKERARHGSLAGG